MFSYVNSYSFVERNRVMDEIHADPKEIGLTTH